VGELAKEQGVQILILLTAGNLDDNPICISNFAINIYTLIILSW